MYFYYEEFPDVTSVCLSADGKSTFINRKVTSDEAIKNLCISLFKQIPLAERDFNEKNYVWTFIGYRGKVIITQLESMCLQGIFPASQVKKIEDLEKKANAGNLNYVKPEEKAKKFVDPNEFYYTPQNTGESLSGSALISKLAPLLEMSVTDLTNASDDSVLKKKYRIAAMRLHPDRNNGDGSKMSELNMLWNIYNNKGV
jgi:hypothetical protein